MQLKDLKCGWSSFSSVRQYYKPYHYYNDLHPNSETTWVLSTNNASFTWKPILQLAATQLSKYKISYTISCKKTTQLVCRISEDPRSTSNERGIPLMYI